MILVLLDNSAVEITVDVSRVLESEGVLEEGVGEGERVLLKSSVVCVADCAELKELVVGIGSIVED